MAVEQPGSLAPLNCHSRLALADRPRRCWRNVALASPTPVRSCSAACHAAMVAATMPATPAAAATDDAALLLVVRPCASNEDCARVAALCGQEFKEEVRAAAARMSSITGRRCCACTQLAGRPLVAPLPIAPRMRRPSPTAAPCRPVLTTEQCWGQGLSIQKWVEIEAEDLQNRPSWWRQIGEPGACPTCVPRAARGRPASAPGVQTLPPNHATARRPGVRGRAAAGRGGAHS